MLERSTHLDYQNRHLLVEPEDLTSKMQMYTAVRATDPAYLALANKKSMNLKFINIVDPIYSKNNLGKSISRLNASRIKGGLTMHSRRLHQLYSRAEEEE